MSLDVESGVMSCEDEYTEKSKFATQWKEKSLQNLNSRDVCPIEAKICYASWSIKGSFLLLSRDALCHPGIL